MTHCYRFVTFRGWDRLGLGIFKVWVGKGLILKPTQSNPLDLHPLRSHAPYACLQHFPTHPPKEKNMKLLILLPIFIILKWQVQDKYTLKERKLVQPEVVRSIWWIDNLTIAFLYNVYSSSLCFFKRFKALVRYNSVTFI